MLLRPSSPALLTELVRESDGAQLRQLLLMLDQHPQLAHRVERELSQSLERHQLDADVLRTTIPELETPAVVRPVAASLVTWSHEAGRSAASAAAAALSAALLNRPMLTADTAAALIDALAQLRRDADADDELAAFRKGVRLAGTNLRTEPPRRLSARDVGKKMVDLAGEARSEWITPSGAAAALAALAAAAYVWFRLATDVFYGALGASPEALGVGYPTVLAQSAYGLFAWFVGLLAGLLLVSVPAQLTARWVARPVRFAGVVLLLALTLVVVLRLVLGTGVASWRTLLGWLVFAAAIGIVGYLLWQFREGVRTIERHTGSFVGALILAAAVLATIVPFTSAWTSAQGVRSGEGSIFRVYGASLFPWAPEVAEIKWRDGGPPSTLRDTRFECVFYLGEAPQGAVIYATRKDGTRQLLRVQPEQADVVVMPDASGCVGWPDPQGHVAL